MNRNIVFFLVFLLLTGCASSSNSQGTTAEQERFTKKIKIGMTTEQVQENWGIPDKTIKKNGKNYDEVWIYVPHWKFKNYLYFRNNFLVGGEPNPESIYTRNE